MIVSNVSALTTAASAAHDSYYTAAAWPCPGCASDAPTDPTELVRVMYVHRSPICYVLCPLCERTMVGSDRTKRRELEKHVRKACTRLFMESLEPLGNA